MKTGLCSISFRQLDPLSIIQLVSKARLDGIEWGGDIHCPASLGKQALQQIASSTVEAGLKVIGYGSYFSLLNESTAWQDNFLKELEATDYLNAPTIRIWVRGVDSHRATEAHYQEAVAKAVWCAEKANSYNIEVAVEFHIGGLTDAIASTVKLLRMASHKNLKTYWQPPIMLNPSVDLLEFKTLLPYLRNIHVFSWRDRDRLSLIEGSNMWEPLIQYLQQERFEGALLLEFIQNNSTEQFLRDAATLLEWTSNRPV
jgi:3-dehydroshikimate dehydratase